MAFASYAPLGGVQGARFRLPGEPGTGGRTAAGGETSGGYFGLLGMRIVAGRDIEPADGDDAVVVSQSMARDVWPDENPLGKTLIDGVERRVVGVVNDASMRNFEQMETTMFRSLRA